MKTVSTKLSVEDFEIFQEMCNEDGQCISEGLRDLIKSGIEAYEDWLEMKKKEKKDNFQSQKEPEFPIPKVEILSEDKKPIPTIHGKILDNHGNVVGTF